MKATIFSDPHQSTTEESNDFALDITVVQSKALHSLYEATLIEHKTLPLDTLWQKTSDNAKSFRKFLAQLDSKKNIKKYDTVLESIQWFSSNFTAKEDYRNIASCLFSLTTRLMYTLFIPSTIQHSDIWDINKHNSNLKKINMICTALQDKSSDSKYSTQQANRLKMISNALEQLHFSEYELIPPTLELLSQELNETNQIPGSSLGVQSTTNDLSSETTSSCCLSPMLRMAGITIMLLGLVSLLYLIFLATTTLGAITLISAMNLITTTIGGLLGFSAPASLAILSQACGTLGISATTAATGLAITGALSLMGIGLSLFKCCKPSLPVESLEKKTLHYS